MNKRVLCVDDDPNILAAHQRNLRKQFDLEVAAGGREAIECLRGRGPFAVILADMRMPGMDGLQVLAEARRAYPETVRLMLTGNGDQQTAIDAVNQGQIFRFLTKPSSVELLRDALQAAVEQYRLITAERELLENTLNGAVKALTSVLAMVAPDLCNRGEQLRDQVRAYAAHFNLKQSWTLEMAAMLSSVGFVAIPPSVLSKLNSRLTLLPEERDMITRVPQTGAELLANIPRLDEVSRIVHYQMKHFDGSGFPRDNITGEQIPIGARILKAFSGLFEAESKGLARHQALSEMRAEAGLYDPHVLDSLSAFFDISLPETSTDGMKVIELPLQELRPGHKLAAPVLTTEGTLLLSSGTRLSPVALEKLRNFAELRSLGRTFLVIGEWENQPPESRATSAASLGKG